MTKSQVLKVLPIYLLLGSGVAFIGTTSAAEDYSTWTYSENITLNTSATGANVAGDVTGFPVLVRLTTGNFIFAEAQGQGQDVRFAKTSGAPLSYQIERWDSTAAQAEVWVKMDTVLGNAASQSIKMYCGKAGVADSSRGSLVFDSGNGFLGVWHLNEEGNSNPGNYKDATVKGSHGTGLGMGTGSKQMGAIGLAQNFSGSANSIALPPLGTDTTAAITVSAWVYANVLSPGGSYDVIWNNDNWATHDLHIQFTNSRLRAGLNGNSPVDLDASFPFIASTWYHIASVYDATSLNMKFYVNGVRSDSITLAAARGVDLVDPSHIGAWNASRFFNGKIDELEISTATRSPDWIKLSYENQKASQSLVTLKLSPRCMASFIAPRDTTLNEGSSLTLMATSTCSSTLFWSVISGPAPSILDPESKLLVLTLPRVAGDTALVYRLTAVFPDSSPYRDIRVSIKESSPDPIFTLPVIQPWNGTDTLPIRPTISNLASIKAGRDSVIHWSWTLSGTFVDTAWLNNGLMLKSSTDGILNIDLCLDNGGKPMCKSTSLTVKVPVSLSPVLRPPKPEIWRTGFDLLGRTPLEPESSFNPKYLH